jgi:hypothetical protein
MSKKNIISLIVLLLFIPLIDINSQIYYSNQLSVRLIISSGVDYNFPIKTDYVTQQEGISIDVPLNFCFDIRTTEWVSLYTGIEFYYDLHSYSQSIDDENYTYYINSLFIRFPLMAKFYPMYDKDRAYNNFYIAIGGLLHTWPVNTYYVTAKSGIIHTGNCYSPTHSEMPPGTIYTHVNVGMRFAIGNHFYVSNISLVGIEMYLDYLFIPSINGYYFGVNYNRGNGIIMEFSGSIGVLLSIGIDLTSSVY